MERTDILICGAGIAGLAGAALLARQGWRVTLVDPATPAGEAGAEGSDLRSTAYLAPARALLDRAGLWQQIAPHATPLAALSVIDSAGDPPQAREGRRFLPGDLGLDRFGDNVPNWLARKVLTKHVAGLDRVALRLGTGFAGLTRRDGELLVRLSDGSRVAARLLIGADGRASPVREAAGIEARITRYGQKALAFAATHERPHENVSTEIYRSGGAFTTVPLPDHQGRPASAIVWMEDGPRAVALAAMGPGDLGAQMTARALELLGEMRPVTPVRLWPIVTQQATGLTAHRIALIAEAAHVLPPIGAQGLNTSLQDVGALAEALGMAPGSDGAGDPGAAPLLARYAAARERDVALRARSIDLFNRICRSGAPLAQGLRRAGLSLAHDVAPLRLALMRAGMGAGMDTAGDKAG